MKEIKFRVWDKEDKEMRVPTDIWSIHLLAGKPSDYILMQFTGLLDGQGKEIYEGDICKDEYGDVGEIQFGKGFEGEPADGTYPYYGWCFGEGETTGFGDDDLTILGNIWENPNLMEELNA